MDCTIRLYNCPPGGQLQPIETIGTLAQSRKCYMKIQWLMCTGRRMGLPPLLTLIYFNWKH